MIHHKVDMSYGVTYGHELLIYVLRKHRRALILHGYVAYKNTRSEAMFSN